MLARWTGAEPATKARETQRSTGETHRDYGRPATPSNQRERVIGGDRPRHQDQDWPRRRARRSALRHSSQYEREGCQNGEDCDGDGCYPSLSRTRKSHLACFPRSSSMVPGRLDHAHCQCRQSDEFDSCGEDPDRAFGSFARAWAVAATAEALRASITFFRRIIGQYGAGPACVSRFFSSQSSSQPGIISSLAAPAEARPPAPVRWEHRTTCYQHFHAGQAVSEGGLELRPVMC